MRDWVTERLSRYADREAVICDGDVARYRDLHDAIRRWQAVLEDQHVPEHAVVALRGEYSPAIISLFLALTCNDHIVAPLPTAGPDPEDLLGISCAEMFFDFAGPSRWTSSLRTAKPAPPLLKNLQRSGRAGLIAFSSGTTGESKAALFDFATLLRRYRDARAPYRTLLFLSLDHLGGINTLLHAVSCGSTVVVCKDRRAETICEAVQQYRIDLLPTTPTFLRMLVISGLYEKYDLSSLRTVTYGTEPMPIHTLQHLTRLLPWVRFKQTYGLTELGVLPTRSKASGSLWLQVGGVGCEVRIVDDTLWIRSETAMLGYLNAPNPFDRDGWYNTGDLVELDGDYVRILGRRNDIVNVGGEKVHPIEVESVLLEMENIREATVWGRPNPVTGQVVAARLTIARPESRDSLEQRILAFCKERLAPYKVPVHVELADDEQVGGRFKKVRPRLDESPARN
jgi:long-chain acyl-CoA synthetase